MIPGVQRTTTTTPRPNPQRLSTLRPSTPPPANYCCYSTPRPFFAFGYGFHPLGALFQFSAGYVDISDLSLRFSFRDFFSVFHLWLLRLGGDLLFFFGFSGRRHWRGTLHVRSALRCHSPASRAERDWCRTPSIPSINTPRF